MRRFILAGVVVALPLAGCAEMTPTQQRALSGTAMGAGNAGLGAGIGAVAGLAGGLIYDKVKKDQAASYSSGYQAGANRQPPSPPQ
jgi:hypothetical protein